MPGMNLFDMITQAAGGGAMKQVGQQFGLSDGQTQQAMKALLPAISGGLKRNASTADGMQALLQALDKGHHDEYIDNPDRLAQSETVDDGNAILGHLLGSKEMSRQVAAQAAQRTGVDTGVLKKMLPMVAALAMGSLSKQSKDQSIAQAMVGALAGNMMSGGASQQAQSGGGLLGALAGQVFGGGSRSAQSGSSGGLGALLGAVMGGGGQAAAAAPAQKPDLGLLGGLLDADGDGNAMDDIFDMVMKR